MGRVHVTIKVSGGLGSMVSPKCCRQECNMRALNVRNITTSSTRDKSAFLSESFFSATVVAMAKDTSRPKAINIIRPNHSLSTTTTNNKRSIPKSNVSSSSSSLTRKPKVTTSAKIAFDQGNGASGNKPQLNIYRPPLRSHQQQGPQVLAPQPRVSITTTPTSNGGGNTTTSQRPKTSLQDTVPRSLTTPILASNSTPVSIADRFQRRTTPTPPPTSLQQQQQHGAISPPSSHPPSSSVMTRSRTLHTVNAILTTASDDEEESETDEEDNTSANEDEDDPVINEARVNRKVFFSNTPG